MPLRLLDDRDFPWIDQLLDVVERSVEQPWRVLLERMHHAPLAVGTRVVPSRPRQQILFALRRLAGGRAERARIARRLRAAVLGHPALDRDARDARLAAAAAELGLEPHDVESLLWADLANERPVTLPHGRPAARTLAAVANVDRLQGEMRRAQAIELRLPGTGGAGALVRMAARCGLMTVAAREPRGRGDDDSIVLRVAGPLSLFHATTVYGRALGALVPLLADQPDFELAIHVAFASGPHVLHVAPPLLLPAHSPRAKRSLVDRLARDLERAEYAVDRDPPAIETDEHILFPELAFEHRGSRWLVEIIGFSTTEYLARKLALYEAEGARVMLCVDTKRSKLDRAHPQLLPFERRVDVEALVEAIATATPPPRDLESTRCDGDGDIGRARSGARDAMAMATSSARYRTRAMRGRR